MAVYNKTIWNNNLPPAINAENLNKIEEGIYALSINSLISATISYINNTLSLTLTNNAGVITAQEITIPTDASIIALNVDTSENKCLLRYKTNLVGTWIDLFDFSSVFYTKVDINNCFETIEIEED